MVAVRISVWLVLWAVCSVGAHIVRRSTDAPDSYLDGNEIHCYCNLPSCITGSYMCKTEKTESGCFKRFDLIARQYHYGCLDSDTKQTICPKSPEVSAELPIATDTPYAHQCCFTDMCNHEGAESSNLISSNDLSVNDSDDEQKEMFKNVGRPPPTTFPLYTNSEIWFRAVLIAVPICGLMILLILIFIAVRILRSDIPEDGISSSKLIKEKYEIAAVSGAKLSQSAIPETYSCDLKPTKCSTLFERSFPFVFRQHSQQQADRNHSRTKSAKYRFMSKDMYDVDSLTASVHHVPKVSEKFSRQNLNILKLPYKFNELKQKNCKSNSANMANNNTRGYSVSNSVTSVNSHPNISSNDFKKYNFIR